MFRQSKTLEIALCGLVLMVVMGFGFHTVDVYGIDVTPDPSSNFDLRINNPAGITFHDDKFWIVDNYYNNLKIVTYNPDGTGAGYVNLNLKNKGPSGIAFGDDKFWVVDRKAHKVFTYNSDGTSLGLYFDLGMRESTGIAFGDDKFWVVYTGFTQEFGHSYSNEYGSVVAYNPDGTPDPSSNFDLDSSNNHPAGITFYDDKFWIVDTIDNEVYAYNLDGTPDPSSNFYLAFVNSSPVGITFHDDKFWVLNADFITDKKISNSVGYNYNKVYAYSLDGELNPSNLEAMLTDMKTILSEMQTTISKLENTITNLTTRIEALEAGTLAPDPEPVTTTGISGKIYTDLNNNDTLDAGESGLSGRSVFAVNLSDMSNTNRTSTDANGDYSFELDAGRYWVQVEGTNVYVSVTVLDGSVLTQNLGL
ncbi:MAG: hypothetical protein OXC46_08855 [Thaumarchaeota archaeon]|nr:hypothetical protein [Nitrososphaerota archaeon]